MRRHLLPPHNGPLVSPEQCAADPTTHKVTRGRNLSVTLPKGDVRFMVVVAMPYEVPRHVQDCTMFVRDDTVLLLHTPSPAQSLGCPAA